MRAPLSPGSLLAGRYQLVSCLAASELTEVHAALDLHGNRECAIKLLSSTLFASPGAFPRLQQQCRNLGALPAEGILRATDFGVDVATRQHFIVTERIAFPSLFELSAQRGPLSLELWSAALQTFALAVDAAAQAGSAHGDLKPQNLFLSPEHPSWARISDFGLAELYQSAGLPPPALGWRAPELAPSSPATLAADVYALGLLTFYALTARHASRAMWEPTPDARAVEIELASLPRSAADHARALGAELPRALDAWFARALADDPDARFASAADAAHALGEATHHAKTPAIPGVAALIAAPLVFQELAPSSRAAAAPERQGAPAPSPPAPSTATQSARSSRPPDVSVPARSREHVAGLPTTPPVALLGIVVALLLALLATGSYALFRLLHGRDEHTQGAPSSVPIAPAPQGVGAPSSTAIASEVRPSARPVGPTQARFVCTPQGCDGIVCDGESVKKGVDLLALAPGRHSCSASRNGYRTAVVEFDLEAGKTTNVVFELLSLKPTGTPGPKPLRVVPKAPNAAGSAHAKRAPHH